MHVCMGVKVCIYICLCVCNLLILISDPQYEITENAIRIASFQ